MSTSAESSIIPRPQNISMQEGEFTLTPATKIFADSELLSNEAEFLSVATKLSLTTEDEASGIKLTLDDTLTDLGAEGYKLEITNAQIIITAATPAGVFYGIQSLLQILPIQISGDAQIPCLCIKDAPRFKWRGIMLDVARHYMPIEFIKKFIDLLAMHKLNTLHFHLTEDQGWRIEIKKYPQLTEIGSKRDESPIERDRKNGDGVPYGPYFYTQDQLRDIVAYAKTRHITVVPEIEMPGHALGILAAFPEFGCTGGPYKVWTRWGVSDDVLCAGNDEVFSILQDVLTEVFDVFDSKYVHIGADECPKTRWKECPKCQARIKEENLEDEKALQSWFIKRIEKFLNDNNKQLIGWDEILEGGLAPNATVMAWREIAEGVTAASQGHDVIMTPKSHVYFDYYESDNPDEPEAIFGLLPLEQVYSLEPVHPDIPEDEQHHVIGVQANTWTEYMWEPKDVEYRVFPRALALSEVAWTEAKHKDFEDFTKRVETHVKRLDALEVNYRPGITRIAPKTEE